MKPDELIITQDDVNLCLGSTELLRCPFCGDRAMSAGRKTPNGKATCWTIQCLGMDNSLPNCTASVWATNKDAAVARQQAVERWNRRPEDKSEEVGYALLFRQFQEDRNMWTDWEEIIGDRLIKIYGKTPEEWKSNCNTWIHRIGKLHEYKICRVISLTAIPLWTMSYLDKKEEDKP